MKTTPNLVFKLERSLRLSRSLSISQASTNGSIGWHTHTNEYWSPANHFFEREETCRTSRFTNTRTHSKKNRAVCVHSPEIAPLCPSHSEKTSTQARKHTKRQQHTHTHTHTSKNKPIISWSISETTKPINTIDVDDSITQLASTSHGPEAN